MASDMLFFFLIFKGRGEMQWTRNLKNYVVVM